MRQFLLYGRGVPRYIALWLPLTPLLVAVLATARARRDVVVVVIASTLPTFLLHNPPYALGFPLRWVFLVAALALLVAWLAARVRAQPGTREERREAEPPAWALALALAAVALVVRVPLAWLDPGISDFATATETAAEQLLAGQNPWTLPNPYATVGTYQYPIATPLAALPFVALVPEVVAGEAHVGSRAAVWAVDVAAVLFLAWAGARAGSRRAGLLAAAVYALHPTLVRESGIVVANDILLAFVALCSAYALWRGRLLLAAAAVGIAISVKPAAAVLLVLLFFASGARPAAVAAAVPVLLQLPFLLWPRPGLWGLWAIAEPLTRREPPIVLELSAWWPVYALFGGSQTLLRVLGVLAVLGGFAAAAWAGRALRQGATLPRVLAAYALVLLVPFVLATVQRTNYQDWYLPSFLLCAALVGAGERRRPQSACRASAPASQELTRRDDEDEGDGGGAGAAAERRA